jgi:serine phosphatase RsbU (regulator of sigma subunit)
MLGGALLEADRQRRALRRQVEVQREAAARLAGELEGARRIQMGLLPSPAAAFAGDARVTLWAFLEPARAVGGDLYDFFPLDGERVFVMVGDVSGKGLPASLFMAFTKSVCRSAALRRGGHLVQVLDEVNRELSRENPEGLYVTLVAVVLDARTGALEYCAAGHDAPYLLRPGGGEPRRLAGAGGLPVGVADGAAYATGRHQMAAGEMVCLLTDGVADAESASGDFYGRRRLETVLGGLPAAASPETVGTAIRADVERFTAGVDAADDVAIVVLRWNGPDALSGR